MERFSPSGYIYLCHPNYQNHQFFCKNCRTHQTLDCKSASDIFFTLKLGGIPTSKEYSSDNTAISGCFALRMNEVMRKDWGMGMSMQQRPVFVHTLTVRIYGLALCALKVDILTERHVSIPLFKVGWLSDD